MVEGKIMGKGALSSNAQILIVLSKNTQTCNNRSPTSKCPQAAAGPYVFIDEIKILVF